MDEVSGRAEVADAVDDSRLAVSVPRNEVERILATNEEVDLVLDVVRTNGEQEERRIFLAWDREALRRLVDQGGERIVVAIDPKSLQEALNADVEAHGMREAGAMLAVLVATAGGGAGMASAHPAEGNTPAGGAPTIEATVETSGWQGEAVEAGYGVRGTPSDAAEPTSMTAAVEAGYGVRGTPSDVAEPTSMTAAVEAGYGVRGTPSDVAGAGDDGGSVSAPSAGVTAALAGGAALTIAAAAFALRRRREPEPAT